MDELENVKTELVLTALSCSNLSSLTLSKKVCSIVREKSYQRIGWDRERKHPSSLSGK